MDRTRDSGSLGGGSIPSGATKTYMNIDRYFSTKSIHLKKLLSFIILSMISAYTIAQSKTYLGSSSEYIFSLSQTTTKEGPSVDPVLRFSMWFNSGAVIEQRLHKNIGIVSGLNIRNVGIINKMDSIRLKHRVYGAGVPLAIRIGNLDKKVSVTLGAEAEFFLNYKVKEFVNKEKIYKKNEWLADEVELFNPSVFAQVQFGKSYYIRFKYYLNNFLKECVAAPGSTAPCGYTMHNNAKTVITGYPLNSQLFYISLGSERLKARKTKVKGSNETTPEPTPTKNTKTI